MLAGFALLKSYWITAGHLNFKYSQQKNKKQVSKI